MLMSGGVDSSVTAHLLKQAGWDVIGLTMKIPMAGRCGHLRACCGIEAVGVCEKLDIPHYFVDVRDAFNKLVIEPFYEAYGEGRTPSPCIDCNSLLKFGVVWELVEREFGALHLATGHYAQIISEGGCTRLKRGADRKRDQSYFIYGIPPHRLPFLHLPLGTLGKKEVRQIAQDTNLPTAARSDSMELCFAGEGDYRNALAAQAAPGPIIDTAGNRLGEHGGVHNFTIGQRHGLRIAAKHPLYVVDIEPAEDTIIVGTREEASRREVRAAALNVLAPELLKQGARFRGKARSVGEPEACTLVHAGTDLLSVRFDEPLFAPAPGQHLVLYTQDGCVAAGGVIQKDRAERQSRKERFGTANER